MSISLQKGQKVSLTKEAPGLSRIIVGLGWDAAEVKRGFFSPKPASIDCDASALLFTNGKVVSNSDVVYFNNLRHISGSVNHCGDNLTGDGDGDDEQIKVDLSQVPAQYDKVMFVVTIYQAVEKKQHFGLIKNAYIRLVNEATGQEVCRYNLSDNYDGMTAMLFGEVYRHNGEWKFNAMGQGTTDPGIGQLAKRFM